MQIYRKTRRGLSGILLKLSIKIFISLVALIIVIFVISKLDLPKPNKFIKQKISNENFKTIK